MGLPGVKCRATMFIGSTSKTGFCKRFQKKPTSMVPTFFIEAAKKAKPAAEGGAAKAKTPSGTKKATTEDPAKGGVLHFAPAKGWGI